MVAQSQNAFNSRLNQFKYLMCRQGNVSSQIMQSDYGLQWFVEKQCCGRGYRGGSGGLCLSFSLAVVLDELIEEDLQARQRAPFTGFT